VVAARRGPEELNREYVRRHANDQKGLMKYLFTKNHRGAGQVHPMRGKTLEETWEKKKSLEAEAGMGADEGGVKKRDIA